MKGVTELLCLSVKRNQVDFQSADGRLKLPEECKYPPVGDSFDEVFVCFISSVVSNCKQSLIWRTEKSIKGGEVGKQKKLLSRIKCNFLKL